MRFQRVLAISWAAILIFWCAAGMVQATPSAKKSKAKEKHWSGNLVDVSCLVKALSTAGPAGIRGQGSGPPGVSQFMSASGAAASQVGQAGAGGGQQTGPPGGGQGQAPATPPTYPTGPQPSPGMSPEQQQEEARAEQVDKAVKQCTATPSTQTFGLAMSGGRVVKFDQAGNAKAADALKEVEVKPGKTVKAKVTGTLENPTTVDVATVQVKGKRSSGSSSASTGQ